MEPDEYERRGAAASRPRPGTVSLERPAAGVVIVTLGGEHDLNTRPQLGEALARAGDAIGVLVDLTDCAFIDSTVIGVLVVAFQTAAESGRRFELTIPEDARAIRRVATVAGLTTFMTIHGTRAAGLESITAP